MKIIKVIVCFAFYIMAIVSGFGKATETCCKTNGVKFQTGDVDFFDVPGIAERNRIFMNIPLINSEVKYEKSYMRLYMHETTEDIINKYKKENCPKSENDFLKLDVAENGNLKIFHNGNLLTVREIPKGKFFFITIDQATGVKTPTPFWSDIPIIGDLFRDDANLRQITTKWVKIN